MARPSQAVQDQGRRRGPGLATLQGSTPDPHEAFHQHQPRQPRVSPETAKLLALKASILRETPDARVVLSARADTHIAAMDMIVTATSGAGAARPALKRSNHRAVAQPG